MDSQPVAQTSAPSANFERELTKLAELIPSIPFAMFTTVDLEGEIRARPMATTAHKFDGTVRFFTNDDTSKVAELFKDRRVGISLADPERERFVSLSGTASLSQDHSLMAHAWDNRLSGWFPKGLNDPELALIIVRVTEAEYWDTPPSPMANLWGTARAHLGGGEYDPNTHGTLRFDPESGSPIGR